MLLRFIRQNATCLSVLCAISGCGRASYVFKPDALAYHGTAPEVIVVAPAEAAATSGIPAATLVPEMMPHLPRQIHHRHAAGRTIRDLRPLFRHSVRVAAGSEKTQVASAKRMQPNAPRKAISHQSSSLSTSPRHRSRAVAVILAVLLGVLGAHLFYLGYHGQALRNLLFTLVGVTLGLLAIPIANVAGSGLGGALIGVAVLCSGVGVVAAIFVSSLVDAVRILTNDIQPANGSYNSRDSPGRPGAEDAPAPSPK